MRLKVSPIYLLVFLNFSTAFHSQAHALPCEDGPKKLLKSLLEEPAEILAIFTREPFAGELLSSGRFLAPGEKIAKLTDGAYIYIIEADGTVGFTNRIPNLKNEIEPLATHYSIYNNLKKARGRNPKIVAAGEFELHNGRVSLLNNKSGSFRGGQKQLELAKKTFLSHQLPVEETTVLHDYATQKINAKHGTELMAAQAAVKLHLDPLSRNLVDELSTLRKLIYEHYPSNKPGMIDWKAFFASEKSLLSNRSHDMDFLITQEGQTMVKLIELSEDYTEGPQKVMQTIRSLGLKRTQELLRQAHLFEGIMAF